MHPSSPFPDGDLRDLPGLRRGFVLDVRPESEFRAGHLRGAVSHPWPGDAGEPPGAWLPSIFLPPRHEPLLVTAGAPDVLEAVLADLRARERDVAGLVLDAAALAACPSDLLADGPSQGFLWRPPPWLADHAASLPEPALGPAVDLGCGSGRAAVWLAARGHEVLGVDHEAEALDLGRRLAAAAGCTCDFARANLRKRSSWPPGPWAVLLNFRFLEREMLAAMCERLVPGGVALVRTFRDEPGWTGPPKWKHRLRRGELLRVFDSERFEILDHAEDFDGDGRPAAGIVARRRAT